MLSQLKQLTDGMTLMRWNVDGQKCVGFLQYNNLSTTDIEEADNMTRNFGPSFLSTQYLQHTVYCIIHRNLCINK